MNLNCPGNKHIENYDDGNAQFVVCTIPLRKEKRILVMLSAKNHCRFLCGNCILCSNIKNLIVLCLPDMINPNRKAQLSLALTANLSIRPSVMHPIPSVFRADQGGMREFFVSGLGRC